ncbi:uncharacterized protein K460DRAFT_366297 [Cucurbitaria berberidis CBS 394.84]|uniref:Uncharacterized protein n=1 Tax=Cucurbitaria berberidis CBS 394.84 TaxID=1168544 RepID=A0A9P4GHI0_9PLEO|nr:uncharacterized protein K460DRAFT_366297 [Cucurbitaria berberidis CBS 394.84]KAF1845412.1 hypothetical protein K460DRAFT_366297 [Cucurbitaria berberidis CBS 394.84]
MAPRGRSTIASHDGDRSYDSSPDPLALSTNENTAKAMRQTTQREPFTASSPNKQNNRLDLSGVDFSSPSKSLIMNTPRMGSASPWRIKVTVQAEPGSDEEHARSPSVKRFTRTKTTTVPLKDPDAQSPAKRPRGRPRKSDVAAAARPKRSGTPLKKASRSDSRDASLGAVESSAGDVDTDVPLKKRRGRPRKSVQLPAEDDETSVVQVPEARGAYSLNATPEPVMKSKFSSSKKSTRFATPETLIPLIETTDATPQVVPTELGKTLRPRKGTPHSKKAIFVEPISDEGSDEGSDLLTPSSGDEDFEHTETMQNTIVPRAMSADLHTQSENSSTQSSEEEHNALTGTDDNDPDVPPTQMFEDDDDDEFQDNMNFAFDEGATRMPDDTTVLDSESFSMISVDSLPNNGSLSSPPKAEDVQNTAKPRIGSLLQHEYLRPTTNSSNASGSQTTDRASSDLSYDAACLLPIDTLHPVPSPRYKTPAIDTEVPQIPPAINPVQTNVPKTETPRLGRVVTAGVVLQGVLDPSRLTPQPSQKARDEKRDELDDLFRGFSEGTRKELQAGLRLGEQLAQDQTNDPASPGPSSPIKEEPKLALKEGIFRTQRKYRQSRLLTPEERDDHITTPAGESVEANDVQYPSLNVEDVASSLISPASSEDEMSWRIDTPPVVITSAQRERFENASNERRRLLRGRETANAGEATQRTQQDDYPDIWQEEASRSSNSLEEEDVPPEVSLQLQDIFADDGVVKPARGKLPRTWRRKSANNFQYSDEAESPQQLSPPQTKSSEPVSASVHEGKAKLAEITVAEDGEMEDDDEEEEDSYASDASDDTGMFFQSNMPNIFKNNRATELKQKKVDKPSLSTLLNEGESLVPESSPPVATKNSLSATKTNPFLDTPPRFPGLPTSPNKSSPLRRELRGSDISSDSPYRITDESSLPLPQSSPFHTIVDGESMLSVASDQRQFRVEMEGSTTSSIRRVRNEANEYLDAYEPQQRSLNEITEITEPSRTWHKDTTVVLPSPPPKQESFAQSMLSPTRRPVSLFSSHRESHQMAAAMPMHAEDGTEETGTDESSVYEDTDASSNSGAQPSNSTEPTEQHEQPTTGIFSRLTSTLFEALSRPATAAAHPILSRLTPLPRIEPWTKTHYKALDKLYTTHLKHPALFSPSIKPATPLSQTNTDLLNQFLSTSKHAYVGAVYSVWGYSMVMSEELVVLCAVYMQSLSLKGIDEYENFNQREIQMGDCAPGRSGDAIRGDDVVKRLATIVIGEAVRRDEKAGKEIHRRGALTVAWPQ